MRVEETAAPVGSSSEQPGSDPGSSCYKTDATGHSPFTEEDAEKASFFEQWKARQKQQRQDSHPKTPAPSDQPNSTPDGAPNAVAVAATSHDHQEPEELWTWTNKPAKVLPTMTADELLAAAGSVPRCSVQIHHDQVSLARCFAGDSEQHLRAAVSRQEAIELGWQEQHWPLEP